MPSQTTKMTTRKKASISKEQNTVATKGSLNDIKVPQSSEVESTEVVVPQSAINKPNRKSSKVSQRTTLRK